MKILIFCPYYPPHIGGLETHSDEFNQRLVKQETDITVFTPNIPYQEKSHEVRYDRVTIIRFPAFEIIENYPFPKIWILEFWKLFISLYFLNFDVVISRTRFFLTSLLALMYAKIKKIRYIHIEHGSDFVQLSNPLKTVLAKGYDHVFGRIIFRFSDLNISISQAVQRFIAKFDTRPSPVIYRGIDFFTIDRIISDYTIKQAHEGKIIIATASRLYKWKGIEYSIAAIRSLPIEIQSKVVFIIMGNGEDFNRLQSLTKGLPIKMLGDIPREKVISILKISDIYLHASLPGGGLSTSLLEAMYCECAAIATPNEGADEIITSDNGVLIEEPSGELLAKNIAILFHNANARRKYSQHAKDYILTHFEWEKSIQSYRKVFSDTYAQ